MATMQVAAQQNDLTISVENNASGNIANSKLIGSVNAFYALMKQTITDFKSAGTKLNDLTQQSVISTEHNLTSLSSQNMRVESLASAVLEMSENISEVAKTTENAANMSTETASQLINCQSISDNASKKVSSLISKLHSVQDEFRQLEANTT